jgi:hypothetical protein
MKPKILLAFRGEPVARHDPGLNDDPGRSGSSPLRTTAGDEALELIADRELDLGEPVRVFGGRVGRIELIAAARSFTSPRIPRSLTA